MSRLLAFELEFVREEDIIVTADVDAFIMTKDILLPLKLVKFSGKQKNMEHRRQSEILNFMHLKGFKTIAQFTNALSIHSAFYQGRMIDDSQKRFIPHLAIESELSHSASVNPCKM